MDFSPPDTLEVDGLQTASYFITLYVTGSKKTDIYVRSRLHRKQYLKILAVIERASILFHPKVNLDRQFSMCYQYNLNVISKIKKC